VRRLFHAYIRLEVWAEGMGDTSLSRVSGDTGNRVNKVTRQAVHLEGRKEKPT